MELNYYKIDVIYMKGNRIEFNGKIYQSNKNGNINHSPNSNMVDLTSIESKLKMWWILL